MINKESKWWNSTSTWLVVWRCG